MGLNFFKRKNRAENPPEKVLEGFKEDIIEELKDIKKIMRRQGLQLEVLKKELQENNTDKDKTANSLLEISEAFFHLEKSFKQQETLSISQIKAFEMVWERLEAVLDSLEITLVREEDGMYDPRLYEAVETHFGGGGPPRVKEVLLPGHLFQGKVLKPAKAIIEQ